MSERELSEVLQGAWNWLEEVAREPYSRETQCARTLLNYMRRLERDKEELLGENERVRAALVATRKLEEKDHE